MTRRGSREPERAADRARAWALLALMAVLYLVFAWFYIPRLNNYVFSDMEFTGWTGPIAARLLRGERPYVDFVLPIPPGSFIVLAAVQSVMGQKLLLQELSLIAISHLCMALLAYAIAARLTSRCIAVLVAASSLVILLESPKECAYDHTAQLCAWGSLALGVRALFAKGRSRSQWWAATGLFAALTLAFKQSTAVGIVGGWLVALGYLGGMSWFEHRKHGASGAERVTLSDAKAWLAGTLAGSVLVVVVVLATGSTLAAFARAVLIDGPELKGGTFTLLANIAKYMFLNEAFPSSIVFTLVMIGVGRRIVRENGGFHVGDEPDRPRSLDGRTTALIALALVLCFGVAIALLALEVRALPRSVLSVFVALRSVPMFGLAFACVFFVAHLLSSSSANAPRAQQGHAINALLLVALIGSLLHGLSLVVYRPFYYNDPLIPLAVACLFIASERARLRWLTFFLFVLTLSSLFSAKYERALSADVPVETGHWRGMRVNYRGVELMKATARVQELVAPSGSVLVLPEDVQLTALIARRRPPLRGAIIFVDQYPERLLAADLASFEQNLPDVIVIHPRQRAVWRAVYATWSSNSGAERFLQHVLDDVIPMHYRLDSSYRTIFLWDQGQLDVWARRDRAGPGPREQQNGAAP